MKEFLEKYYKLFGLFMVGLYGWILGGAVSEVAGYKIERSIKGLIPQVENISSGQLDIRTKKTKGALDKLIKQIEKRPKQEETLTIPEEEESNIEISNLNLELIATIYSPGGGSLCIIKDNGKSDVYRIGEDINGKAKVIEIRPREVVIKRGNKKELLVLEEKRKGTRSRFGTPRRLTGFGSRKSGKKDNQIKKVGDNRYVISRELINDSLNNLSKLGTQARIMPHFSNGKAVGFKLYSIAPNSLYSKIGLKNGDVVKKINGFNLDSPEKALEIYQKLRTSDRVTIEIERRGRDMQLQYNIE